MTATGGGAYHPGIVHRKPLEVLDSRRNGVEAPHQEGQALTDELAAGKPPPVRRRTKRASAAPTTPEAHLSNPGIFDEPRAAGAAICPFLRHQNDSLVVAPNPVPDAANVCIAAGDPRPQSIRQQELLCLHLSHADCPRYIRAGLADPDASAEPAHHSGRVPRATVAALLVLLLSAGMSFGFVLRRGGIDLSSFAAPSSTAGAVVPSVAVATASAVAGASPDVTAATSLSPSPSPPVTPTLAPSPAATPAPTPTPKPIPPGSPSRMKLVTACPGVTDCYIYRIKSGDSLYSVAQFFGVKLSRIYAMNPTVKPSALHAGTQLKIPTPTR